jgi:hypothetical protein
MKLRTVFTAAVLLAAPVATPEAGSAPADAWSAVRALEGSWTGARTGGEANATSLRLRVRTLWNEQHVEIAADGAADGGTLWTVLSWWPEGDTIATHEVRADGRTLDYDVALGEDRRALVFDARPPAGAVAGWRLRRTLRLLDSDTIEETVESSSGDASPSRSTALLTRRASPSAVSGPARPVR